MSAKKDFSESTKRVIARHGDGLTITITDDQKVAQPGGGVAVTVRSFTVKCQPPVPHTKATEGGARVETGDTMVVIDRLDPLITFEPAAEMKAALSTGEQFTISKNDIRTGSYRLQLKGGSPS